MHNHVSLLQSRFQRLETSRHHIVLDLEKVKPSFLWEIFAAEFSEKNWVCFAVATWSHWCCLTHNMPPSAPTKQRWLRTSVPRVFEDTSTGKWRLRLLYTRARGQKPGRKQSIWFTSRADAENAADSWRRSWEEGRQGVLPTEPLSPSKPEETEALSPELPKGKCHLCEYVSRLQK